jgi:hypothetical protein
LGDKRSAVRDILGEPDTVTSMSPQDATFEYFSKGLTVTTTEADGVSVIVVQTRRAGSLDGLRVRATTEALLAKWGLPQSAYGPIGLYDAGNWTVAVTLDTSGKRIAQLMLAWNERKLGDASDKVGQRTSEPYRPK